MRYLKDFKKNITKIVLILIITFPITLFLNTGFQSDSYWKIIQVIIFTLVFTLILIWPQFKKNVFWLGLILIICMGFLYTARLIEFADILGSTGIGFIMINLISYLPQLIKLGYIKNL